MDEPLPGQASKYWRMQHLPLATVKPPLACAPVGRNSRVPPRRPCPPPLRPRSSRSSRASLSEMFAAAACAARPVVAPRGPRGRVPFVPPGIELVVARSPVRPHPFASEAATGQACTRTSASSSGQGVEMAFARAATAVTSTGSSGRSDRAASTAAAHRPWSRRVRWRSNDRGSSRRRMHRCGLRRPR